MAYPEMMQEINRGTNTTHNHEAPTNKIWKGPLDTPLRTDVESYTVGKDSQLDISTFLPYDVVASRAHVAMLRVIGILQPEEEALLASALTEIDDMYKCKDFSLLSGYEDSHTAIETYITVKYGDIGKKMHTGRSRNDQSLTMVRLYILDQLKAVTQASVDVVIAFRDAASRIGCVPMPGFTHSRQAMPTSVDTWLQSYACAFADARPILVAATTLLDQNPLGSGAGFGCRVVHVDRETPTKLLGFSRLQENPMYCGLSRGLFDNVALQAMSLPVMLCSKFANDMMMFTQKELDFFALPGEFLTGSSIMPHKRNYDVFEIMRANGKLFTCYQEGIQSIVSSLGSGYHRDLQQTKTLLVDAIGLAVSGLALLKSVLPHIEVKLEKLSTAMASSDLYSVDEIEKKIEKGTPFRDAYLEVKKECE